MERELNEIDLKIISLYEQGWTTAQIGKEVGKTKNSICGLLSRYREKKSDLIKRGYVKGEKSPRIKRQIGNAPSIKKIKYFKNLMGLEKTLDDREMPRSALTPPVTSGISFWSLKSQSCRYIISGTTEETRRFCGEPIGHKSYCLYHASICYLPNEKRPSQFNEKRKW